MILRLEIRIIKKTLNLQFSDPMVGCTWNLFLFRPCIACSPCFIFSDKKGETRSGVSSQNQSGILAAKMKGTPKLEFVFVIPFQIRQNSDNAQAEQ